MKIITLIVAAVALYQLLVYVTSIPFAVPMLKEQIARRQLKKRRY